MFWFAELCAAVGLTNVDLQFGPVAEAQQEGVLWIMQAQICFHAK